MDDEERSVQESPQGKFTTSFAQLWNFSIPDLIARYVSCVQVLRLVWNFQNISIPNELNRSHLIVYMAFAFHSDHALNLLHTLEWAQIVHAALNVHLSIHGSQIGTHVV
jgi:hypothetical protein